MGPNGNGVLSWIGTNCGRGEWENPALKGEVKITASSVGQGKNIYTTPTTHLQRG